MTSRGAITSSNKALILALSAHSITRLTRLIADYTDYSMTRMSRLNIAHNNDRLLSRNFYCNYMEENEITCFNVKSVQQ